MSQAFPCVPPVVARRPDDGGIVWIAGYQVVDRTTGNFLGREAPELAPEIDAGRPRSAVVLREQRRSPRDPRYGLTILLAASPAIELRDS